MDGIKYILFDLDGTILDFKEGERCAFIETIKNNSGYVPNEREIEEFSRINEYYFNEYKNGIMDRKEFHYKRFEEIYKYLNIEGNIVESNNYYVNSLKYQSQLFDDVIEVLEYLNKKYKMYIASNGMGSVQAKRIKDACIDKYFIKNYISEDIGFNKPDIGFFEYVFKDINDYDKSKYVIIGDRIDSDILGGINAKINTIYVNRENNKYDGLMVKDLREIMNIL